MDNWCNGNGYSDLQAVQSDLSQLNTDSGNNDLSAVESDGTQLLSDAGTAESNPPPWNTSPEDTPSKFQYAYYMGALGVAGATLATGDVSKGASDLQFAVQKGLAPIKSQLDGLCGGGS